MIHWSRTAQGLNANFVYQGPGRTVSPREVFISEWSQNLQHMLLGDWEGGGDEMRTLIGKYTQGELFTMDVKKELEAS